MQEFKIKPEAYASLRRKGWLVYGIALLFTIATVVLLVLFNTDSPIMNDAPVILTTIGIMLVFISINIVRGMKKQKVFMENYRLTIEDNVITREQPNTEELTIYFHEIKEITKFKKGSLAIKGFDKTDIIYVPRQITRYDELVAQLETIKPVTPLQGAAATKRKLMSFLPLVLLALYITLFISSNKILVGISGTLVSAGFVWVIFAIRRNKNIANDTKKKVWLYALFLLFTIGITCSKLFDVGF